MIAVELYCYNAHLRFVKSIKGVTVVTQNYHHSKSSLVFAELEVTDWKEFFSQIAFEFKFVTIEKITSSEFSVMLERTWQ